MPTQSRYVSYLASPEWADLRRRVLKRASGVCETRGCRRPGVQVHHKTYERLFREKLGDLEALCAVCHQGRHPEKQWLDRAIDAEQQCPRCPSIHADLYLADRERLFVCQSCGEPFALPMVARPAPKKHGRPMGRADDDSVSVPCPDCDRRFKSAYALGQHATDKHRKIPPTMEDLEADRREAERNRVLSLRRSVN